MKALTIIAFCIALILAGYAGLFTIDPNLELEGVVTRVKVSLGSIFLGGGLLFFYFLKRWFGR